MYAKKSGSLQGEIALTLTLISLGIMLIGTAFGGVRQQQTTNSKAAGNCTYRASARVQGYDRNGKAFTISTNGGTEVLGVINDKLQFHDFKIDPVIPDYAWWDYRNDNFTFSPYKDGDWSNVTLKGLNRNKWKVVDTFCDNAQAEGDKPAGKVGCDDVRTGRSSDMLTITNIKVTCGVNLSYGWKVEEIVNQEPEPTPTSKQSQLPPATPTTEPQCKYSAIARVIKQSTNEPLTFTENGGSANFGVSNDKQSQTVAAGKFGDFVKYGRTSTQAVRYAEYQYANNYEHFKPEFPNAPYDRRAGNKDNNADVTLLGLGSGWKIVGTYCNGTGPTGDKGCPAVKDQGPDATIIKGFKPDCNVAINYGWKVAPIPSPSPSTGAIKFPTGFVPSAGPISGAIPYPTKAPVCLNNKGTLRGHVYVNYDSGSKARSIAPQAVKTRMLIRVCPKQAGKDIPDNCNAFTEFGEQEINILHPETEYAIPNVPTDQEVVVLIQEWDKLEKETVAVQTTNCTAENKRLGTEGTQTAQLGKNCIVKLTAPVCSDGPDFNVTVSTKSPSTAPNRPGHIELEPIQDAFVRSGAHWKDSNFGKQDELELGYRSYTGTNPNDPANTGIMLALLQFDLTGLKDIRVTKATLSLQARGCGWESEGRDRLFYVTPNKILWKEGMLTWNSLVEKKVNASDTIGKAAYTCHAVDPDMNFEGAAMINLVQQWIDNPNKNYGLRLDPTSTGIKNQNTSFGSREAEQIWRPKLIIDYEGTPANKPSTPKPPTKSPAIALRDLNHDGVVNAVDFVFVLRKIGSKGPNIPEDVNKDGVVNAQDAASVIVNFGKKVY